MRGNRLIFVGGVERSGSTLLQNMLDSHPEICGGPEFRHISDIINLRSKLKKSIEEKRIDLFCSYEDVDRHIYSLIENLLLPLADKYNCKFYSEKTPWNILVFTGLMELCPGSHFIHIVRDPRAVIASIIKVKAKNKEKGIYKPASNGRLSDLLVVIGRVKRYLNAGYTASKVAPDKILTVVYERLVSDPELETKKICDFLGIEWSEQMVNPGRIKHLGEKTMIRSNIYYDERSYYQDPVITEINKWKTQLTSTQQALISISFKDFDELLQYGYSFSIDGITKKIIVSVIPQIQKIKKKVLSGLRFN